MCRALLHLNNSSERRFFPLSSFRRALHDGPSSSCPPRRTHLFHPDSTQVCGTVGCYPDLLAIAWCASDELLALMRNLLWYLSMFALVGMSSLASYWIFPLTGNEDDRPLFSNANWGRCAAQWRLILLLVSMFKQRSSWKNDGFYQVCKAFLKSPVLSDYSNVCTI